MWVRNCGLRERRYECSEDFIRQRNLQVTVGALKTSQMVIYPKKKKRPNNVEANTYQRIVNEGREGQSSMLSVHSLKACLADVIWVH